MSDDLAPPPWPKGHGPEGDWRNSYEVQPEDENLEPIHHVMIGSWKLGIRIIEFDPENRRGGAVIESVEHVEPTHDPVDMPHVVPDEASVAAAPITAMISAAQTALHNARGKAVSWELTEATQRAQAHAATAQAQASYAIYLELTKITEHLEVLHEIQDALRGDPGDFSIIEQLGRIASEIAAT